MVKENRIWVVFKNGFKMHTKDGVINYTIGIQQIPKDHYEAYKNFKSDIRLATESEIQSHIGAKTSTKKSKDKKVLTETMRD